MTLAKQLLPTYHATVDVTKRTTEMSHVQTLCTFLYHKCFFRVGSHNGAQVTRSMRLLKRSCCRICCRSCRRTCPRCFVVRKRAKRKRENQNGDFRYLWHPFAMTFSTTCRPTWSKVVPDRLMMPLRQNCLELLRFAGALLQGLAGKLRPTKVRRWVKNCKNGRKNG